MLKKILGVLTLVLVVAGVAIFPVNAVENVATFEGHVTIGGNIIQGPDSWALDNGTGWGLKATGQIGLLGVGNLYGVVGSSESGHGGRFESKSGYGVKAVSETYGIHASSSGDDFGGVIGTDKFGMMPEYFQGAGYAQKNFGVYGGGKDMGVAGRSPSGYGIYGRSNTGIGVYGKSTTGFGVKGQSTSKTFSALYAVNDGGGPALEIGNGWIKLPADTVNSSSGTATINKIAGKVNCFNQSYVTVSNSYVKTNSIVLLTCIDGSISSSSKYDQEVVLTNQQAGSFTVSFRNASPNGAFNFLIINQ